MLRYLSPFLLSQIAQYVGADHFEPIFNSVLMQFMSSDMLLDKLVVEYVSHKVDLNQTIIEEMIKIRNSSQPFNCCHGSHPNHLRCDRFRTDGVYRCDGYQVRAIRFHYMCLPF